MAPYLPSETENRQNSDRREFEIIFFPTDFSDTEGRPVTGSEV